MKIKNWFCAIQIIVFFLCNSAQSAELKVYIAEYPPFQVLSEKGDHSGFSVELFNEIVKLSHLDVEYIPVPWVRAQALVAEQKNSLLFTMAKTPEREELYRWVATIYVVNEGVFSLKSRTDLSINTLDDVHRYSIALPRGDVSVKTLNIFPNNTKGVYIVEHQEQCMKMLNLGRVDLNYNNDVGFFIAAKMLGFNRDKFTQIFTTGQTEMGIVANKNSNPENLRKISQALLILKKNGIYNKIQRKWFTDSIDKEFDSIKL
ncbi:transporter substrate-binding domain-containing protein [Paraglaciecola sp.]|uniref:substrate-binding periplasmic protein n=1 Tax=Paraglaciecola sp. TaxID=1920173 RepID=UPI0030F416DC